MKGKTYTHNLSLSSVLFQNLSLTKLLMVGFAVIVFLLFFYIHQAQEYTQIGFIVSNYEKQIEKISVNQRSLQLNFSKGNSLADIEELLKSRDYQDVGQIKYIKIASAQVAVK